MTDVTSKTSDTLDDMETVNTKAVNAEHTVQVKKRASKRQSIFTIAFYEGLLEPFLDSDDEDENSVPRCCPSRLTTIGELMPEELYAGLQSELHRVCWEADCGKRPWNDVLLYLECTNDEDLLKMIRSQEGDYSMNPLHIVALDAPKEVTDKVVRLTLANGYEDAILATDMNGLNVMHVAVIEENLNCLQSIVNGEQSIEVTRELLLSKDNMGKTPIDYSSSNEMKACLELTFDQIEKKISSFHERLVSEKSETSAVSISVHLDRFHDAKEVDIWDHRFGFFSRLIPAREPKKSLVLALYMTIFSSLDITLRKAVTVYMYNYPSFVVLDLSILQALFLAPTFYFCFVGLSNKGSVDSFRRKLRIISSSFISGLFDGIMLTGSIFSFTYLPGQLCVLLSQATVPISTCSFRSNLNRLKIVGSVFISLGIILIMIILTSKTNSNPLTTEEECLPIGGDESPFCMDCLDFRDEESCVANTECKWKVDTDTFENKLVWAFVLLVLSGLQLLSNVFKVFSFDGMSTGFIFDNTDRQLSASLSYLFSPVISLLFSLLFSLFSKPVVRAEDLGENLSDGYSCGIRGEGSIFSGCFLDDECNNARILLILFLVVRLILQFLSIHVARTSKNALSIFLLASTLVVPICSIIFLLPFFPENSKERRWDNYVSLGMIAVGLAIFRRGSIITGKEEKEKSRNEFWNQRKADIIAKRRLSVMGPSTNNLSIGKEANSGLMTVSALMPITVQQ